MYLSNSLSLFLSLSLSLSLVCRKCRVEGPGGVKSRRPVQRRMTCPSPQEICRALQTPIPLPLTRAASLDELIQLCLHCFGVCL